MRSELVFGAMANVPNRYLLTKLACKATRKLHRPHDRIQETTNAVLVRFCARSHVATTEPAEVLTNVPLRRAG